MCTNCFNTTETLHFAHVFCYFRVMFSAIIVMITQYVFCEIGPLSLMLNYLDEL